jgi:hypothetical protein
MVGVYTVFFGRVLSSPVKVVTKKVVFGQFLLLLLLVLYGTFSAYSGRPWFGIGVAAGPIAFTILVWYLRRTYPDKSKLGRPTTSPNADEISSETDKPAELTKTKSFEDEPIDTLGLLYAVVFFVFIPVGLIYTLGIGDAKNCTEFLVDESDPNFIVATTYGTNVLFCEYEKTKEGQGNLTGRMKIVGIDELANTSLVWKPIGRLTKFDIKSASSDLEDVQADKDQSADQESKVENE